MLARLFRFGRAHSTRISQQKLYTLSQSNNGLLDISEEVAVTLREGGSVVALESTIITHGMPYPHNVQTATEVESIVRQHGSVPATVAVINGKIRVGLSIAELEKLATDSRDSVKTSRRDLAYLIAKGLTGGTTVAGTMIAAHMAGIPLFVTGGVGGVHRGAESTMDISADLRELGRTPVTVVSAGVKSILDIPRTLEYLETEGVGVFSYGNTTDFPAFFTATSGSHAPYNLSTPQEAATVIDAGSRLGLSSGNLIAVPIPEDEAVNSDDIQQAIDTAASDARAAGIQGKTLTPFLLQRVNDLMEGASLTANIALVKNNAAVGSQIGASLADLRKCNQGQRSFQGSSSTNQGQRSHSHDTRSSSWTRPITKPAGQVVVVGGTNIDFTASFQTDSVMANGMTYAGSVGLSFGGVGRNLADGLSRLGQTPLLISALGDDTYWPLMEAQCKHMDLSAVRRCDSYNSATYCAILNSGGLMYGIGDFDVHGQITPDYIWQYEEKISAAPMVVIDGNLATEAIEFVTMVCHTHKVPVFFEPADLRYVQKLFLSDAWRHLTYTSPNLNELRMFNAGINTGCFEPPTKSSDVEGGLSEVLDEVIELARPVVDYIPNILVTIGHHGVVLCRNTEAHEPLPYKGINTKVSNRMSVLHQPVLPPSGRVVSVSGAGDCLVAAFLTSVLQSLPPEQCLARGVLGARVSLSSNQAVPSTLTPDAISMTTDCLPAREYHLLVRSP